MLGNFASVLGLAGFSLLVFAVIILGILIFEIAMLVSAITNKNITDTTKALWVVGMLLIHPFVAIAYYFTDYKKAK